MGEPVREPPEAQTIRDALAELPVLLQGTQAFALAALDVLLSALAQARARNEELQQERDEELDSLRDYSEGTLSPDDTLATGIEWLMREEQGWRSAFAALEAREAALTEALREIAEPMPETEGDWGETYDWCKIAYRRRDIARAALAAAAEPSGSSG